MSFCESGSWTRPTNQHSLPVEARPRNHTGSPQTSPNLHPHPSPYSAEVYSTSRIITIHNLGRMRHTPPVRTSSISYVSYSTSLHHEASESIIILKIRAEVHLHSKLAKNSQCEVNNDQQPTALRSTLPAIFSPIFGRYVVIIAVRCLCRCFLCTCIDYSSVTPPPVVNT